MSLEIKGLIPWLKTWFYDKTEVNNLITQSGGVIVDDELDGTSTNPVENQAIVSALNGKADIDLTPTLVYTCSSFSSYINTNGSNSLTLSKLGNVLILRYFLSTNTLTYSTTDYNINDDQIGSDYRPASNRTFHVATSSNHNAKITITTGGKVKISTDTNSTAISLAGTCIYWLSQITLPSVALSLSSSTIPYGDSVILSATVTNSGVAVVGETVTFYDGASSIGTGTTDSNGVATLTKSDFGVGSHSLTAEYDGVSSSASILTVDDVPSPNSVLLSADKPILSYANSESSTLTATVLDENDNPCSGETVTFKKEGVVFGTGTTNASGVATCNNIYTSTGGGDVSFTAEVDSLVSETFTIRDFQEVYYQNDGTRNDLVCASGTSVTVENGALKVTTSSNGEKKFYFPSSKKFGASDNVCMEFECARETETGQICALSFISSVSSYDLGYCAYSGTENDGYWYCSFNNDGTNMGNSILNKGDIIKLVRENGYSKLYVNDNLIRSVSRSISYYFGGYTNLNRVQRFKNIIIYKL